MEPPVFPLLAAATALFLSFLIASAVGRQATRKSFQKRAFLASVLLLIGAIITNLLLTIFLKPSATSDLAEAAAALVFSKNVQATFDLLFAITIGAFVLATAKPEIDSGRKFLSHLRKQFPNLFVFYVSVQVLAILAVWMSQPNVPSPPFPTVTKFEFPLTEIFMLGLASATVLVYVPYMLLSYVRRSHARPNVGRDVYLIILGVAGYTVSEFVVEIFLPYYAIDGRAIGFVLEMALVGVISFAARERGFLEGLPVPQTEAQATTEPAYSIERGFMYLVLEEQPRHSFEIFLDFVTHGAQGLCITRKMPKDVMEEYGLERTPILWLSRVATQKNSIRPSPPEGVTLAVEHFIGVGRESVVLLDGLEYLIAHNDFRSVLTLFHDLRESIALSDSILLAPIDPQTLSGQEFALLRREAEIIEPLSSSKVTPRVELELVKAAKVPRSGAR